MSQKQRKLSNLVLILFPLKMKNHLVSTRWFFVSIKLTFQLPNILPPELQQPILPSEAAGYLGGIAESDLSLAQVGGDNGVFVGDETGVDDLVQGALQKRCGQVTAQVIQDEQIAGQIALNGACFPSSKLFLLKAAENLNGCVIDHGKTSLRNHLSNTGG